MNIETNKAVTLTYTLTDKDGKVLDKASLNEPFIYLHGTGGIIPGLEKALDGKAKDDKFEINLDPSEAYGDHSKDLIQEVPKDMFGEVSDDQMFVGAQFHAETSQGMQIVTVNEVNKDTITIDGNHPMAGKALSFDVTVLDVRDATEEEIAHGHIHAHTHAHEEKPAGDSCCGGGCGG